MPGKKGFTIEQRFWPKVLKTPTCWLWVAATRNGYGVLGGGRRGTPLVYAHRLSYQMHSGSGIPSGKEICHTCDVRACVNPDHIYLGTRSDNMRDSWQRSPSRLKKRAA
jgi:hypothetical protein